MAVTGAVGTDVVTVNVALVCPDGTTTLAGTMVVEVSLESATDTPPAGAADASVTVPVTLFPETTVAGFSVLAWRHSPLYSESPLRSCRSPLP